MPFGYYFSYFVVLSRCVLAIVWLGLVPPTNPFIISTLQEAEHIQRSNYDRWSMHDCLAHSHLAKLCQYPQYYTSQRGYLHVWNDWLSTLLPATDSLFMHTLHQGMALQLINPVSPPQTFINSTDTTIKVQYFFAFKSFIAPIIFLAIFGSTLHKAGGTISDSTVITQPTILRGSAVAWAFFASKWCSTPSPFLAFL